MTTALVRYLAERAEQTIVTDVKPDTTILGKVNTIDMLSVYESAPRDLNQPLLDAIISAINNGNHTLEFTVDSADYLTIEQEIAMRVARSHAIAPGEPPIVPDGTSCLTGAMIAEMIRDLNDYRDQYEKPDGIVKNPLTLRHGKIQDVLRQLASQENCDGSPYDQMIEAAKYIDELESKCLRGTMGDMDYRPNDEYGEVPQN